MKSTQLGTTQLTYNSSS